MLRVHDVFRQECQGTVRFFVLLETDTIEAPALFRFLKTAIDFAEEYFRKVRLVAREKNPPPELVARIAAGREDRARILGIYRSLQGCRKDRLRELLARLKAENRTETLGSVQMLLAMAGDEERKALSERIEIKSGHVLAAAFLRTAEQQKPGNVHARKR